MRTLQVVTPRTLISHLEHDAAGKRLLHGEAPLIDILRMRSGIKGVEGNHCLTQYGRSEVKPEQAGDIVVALPGLGKNIGRIVALVAPGVHVNGRVVGAESAAKDDPEAANLVGKTNARCKIHRVRIP